MAYPTLDGEFLIQEKGADWWEYFWCLTQNEKLEGEKNLRKSNLKGWFNPLHRSQR
jgi:hypothetical protein